MQMMQAAGFIEHVEDKDRQAALMVVNQVESKKVGPFGGLLSGCRAVGLSRFFTEKATSSVC